MKFEESLEQLDQIVKELENPDIDLDTGIELFQKSLDVTKDCLNSLNEAKNKIATVKSELDDIMKDF